MISRRRLIRLSAASALAPGLIGRAAHAQSWPNRPVRIIIPYAPGGPTDIIARVVADRLVSAWGQQVVIENRSGGGTNIGAEAAARSDPDGYTMFMGGATLAVNRNFYRSLSYDPIADFAPVTLICKFSFFMLVPNSSPAPIGQGIHRPCRGKSGQDRALRRPASAPHPTFAASCSHRRPASR